MNPIPFPHVAAERRRRTLAAGGVLVLALVQAAPAAAQKRGAPATHADRCSPSASSRSDGELGRFLLPGTRAVCAAAADLDGDGLRDYVLVLEQVAAPTGDEFWPDSKRTLLVVARRPDGTLHVAARNDHVVLCAGCGGMFGDPFEGVELEAGTFTVYHYGGSRWRWRRDYTFRYVPAAGTWQLAKVVELSFDSVDPQKMSERILVAPDDFGDIDLAAFHPDG